MLQIEIQGEQVGLLPGKALLWPAQHTLILADMHWGKAMHFRKHGIAIPASAQHADEIRLAEMVRQYGVERLIVAGDMFHSVSNRQIDDFMHWRNAHAQLDICLVAGNHDVLAAGQYMNYRVRLQPDMLDLGPFIITHDATAETDKFQVHGHIHPCFTATGKGRAGVRVPCFCMDNNRLVLPSFGSFTGGHKISADDFRHIYLVAADEVIQWQ